jgi:hypothetical protein
MTPPEPLSTLVKASEVAKTFVSGLGLNVPFLLSFFAASVFLSVAPISVISSPVSGWRGLFVALAILLGTYVVLLWWSAQLPRRQAIWHLKHLGEDERAVLKDYLKQNKTVGNFSVLYGPVCSLIGKGILTYASALIPYSDAPVAIQPYVMAYLRKHPKAIGLKAEDIGVTKLSTGRRQGLNYEAGV